MEKIWEQCLKKVRQGLARGEYRASLQELRRLQAREDFPPKDQWQLDELCGAVFAGLLDMERAAAAYWQASTHDCYLRSQLEHYSSYLFCLHYLPDITPEELLQAHAFYNRMFAAVEPWEHTPGQRQKTKLRIGYISGDFHEHTSARFIQPLLRCRDTERYEAYVYDLHEQEDWLTKRFRGMADNWRNLSGMPFAAAARQIYEDQIDILFDLAGHSSGGVSLILAGHKPAPIQLSGIGWFDTTGLAAMDYFLTDTCCAPPGAAGFTEQLVRLEASHLCYMPIRPLPELGVYAVHRPFTFGCFNNFAKLTQEMLILWLTIVRSVPGARLLLKDTAAAPERCQVLRERMLQMGWQADEFELRSGSENYLQEFAALDIALDPYPYPGGGMTCEALLMGVPVITLAGSHHSSRFGVSLLGNAGLSALIAENPAAYKAKALELAADIERLENLHRTLRLSMERSPLMDGPGYMRALEAAYERMWAAWCSGTRMDR